MWSGSKPEEDLVAQSIGVHRHMVDERLAKCAALGTAAGRLVVSVARIGETQTPMAGITAVCSIVGPDPSIVVQTLVQDTNSPARTTFEWTSADKKHSSRSRPSASNKMQ